MTFASPELFTMLGVKTHLGRFYEKANNVRGGNVNVVVLGHGLWQSRFGVDARVIGRVIQLRGTPYTVVGVMQPGFRFPTRTNVWVPLMARMAAYNNNPRYWNRSGRGYAMLARLKPGVSLDAASAEMR